MNIIGTIKNFVKYRGLSKAYKKTAQQYIDGKIQFVDFMGESLGYGGDKFHKGFGITKDFRVVNLKKLQYRSIQLIRENLYANALFSRLETKVINKGLTLNCAPQFEILGREYGMTDTELRLWARTVEAFFLSWSRDKRYISWDKQKDFSSLQRFSYHTSHLSGDCLVINSINKDGFPVVKLVDGFYISQPVLSSENKGKRIVEGVELDDDNVELAYWVENGVGGHVRVSAFGRGSNRLRSWLVKNTQQRISDVRGMPFLSIMLQNINEASKYMDSEQRAALVNSNIAMTRNRGATQGPVSGFRQIGAMNVTQKTTPQDTNVNFIQQQPGLYVANLAHDEVITSYDTKRPNINFGPFMEACLKPMAYASEMPPEIFFLEYGNNFSASRQANLDFKDAVDKKAYKFGRDFCDPVFVEFLNGLVYSGIIKAPGYIQSLNDKSNFYIKNAWQNTIWRGLPQTSVDIKKLIAALVQAVEKGWLTNEQVSSQYFGTDYFDNVRRLKTENELLADSQEVFSGSDGSIKSILQKISEISNRINDFETVFENSNNG